MASARGTVKKRKKHEVDVRSVGLLIIVFIMLLNAVLTAVGLGVGVYLNYDRVTGDAVKTDATGQTYATSTTLAATTTVPAETTSTTTLTEVYTTTIASFVPPASYLNESLQLSLYPDGNRVEIWEDTIGFYLIVANVGETPQVVELSAETLGNTKLELDSPSFNLAPGGEQKVFVYILPPSIRENDEITVTATSPETNESLNMTVSVLKHFQNNFQKVRSGLDGCGKWALN